MSAFKQLSAISAALIIVLAPAREAAAWMETSTHIQLTDKALTYDSFLKNYFSRYLDTDLERTNFTLGNFDDGLFFLEYERFQRISQKVKKGERTDAISLVKIGAEAEDFPNLPFPDNKFWQTDDLYYQFGSRAANHFHDPTDMKFHPGLDNRNRDTIKALVEWKTQHLNDLSGISAGNRAAGLIPPVFCCEDVNTAKPRNFFDWSHARTYYYKALTSRQADERDHYFSLLFIALGHIMHLEEDMAVPSHTRNDFVQDHLLSKVWGVPNVETFATQKGTYIKDLSPAAVTEIKRDDLRDYWDTRGEEQRGLAEYTNANFLSQGTMTNGWYSSPSLSMDKIVVHRQIYRDVYEGYVESTTTQGEKIDHLARVGLQMVIRKEMQGPQYVIMPNVLLLDEACYDDYVKLLFPKAVSYAAGVLKHFFRGRIEAHFTYDGKLQITNKSDEPMSGQFQLYCESLGQVRSRDPANFWFRTLAPGQTVVIPDVVLPDLNIWRGTSALVFQGTLGQEHDAIVATVFRAANYVKLWRIETHNDNTVVRLIQEDLPTSPRCWVTWHRENYQVTRSGDLSLHYLLVHINVDGGGRPFFLNQGVKLRSTLVPRVADGGIGGGAPLMAVAKISNDCGDPLSDVILNVAPCSQPDGSSNHYCFRGIELPFVVPDPVTVDVRFEMLSRSELEAFLRGIHPAFAIPPEFDRPEATFMLASVPFALDDVNVQLEQSVGAWDKLPLWQQSGSFSNAAFQGGAWGESRYEVRWADDTPLLVQPVYARVYGSGYQFVDEWVYQEGRYERYCVFNPNDPAWPLCFTEDSRYN